ncbi:uncharacterized protein EAF01_001704 [Botrytis porri]|uniref:Nucleotidyltransferase n=1 Tax=Botrytis porri TaxID=87229 RepID=A0A4Z1KB52_9HELO|nr:uncharacterized protein EAF01_001704 [Botrytis porri]KAF7912683.1 hypothetical protein EAF01_001704 [Botrytis porri]TGO82606.1 hypothetical protein BPOR_0793g00030 [Botrytis porri]
MGGHAFSSQVPPIKTPRMTQEVYDEALKQNQAVLRKHYSKVESAIEGPGKTTYGDVDILVALPLEGAFSSEDRVVEELKKALNAKALVQDECNPTINFAVPWPENIFTSAKDENKVAESTDGSSASWYVQVDVHICKSEHEFDWELFHAAHGDLWNIIGTTIRGFGLTINNRAFFIRIPEIELADRKKSMVFLTDNPTEILDFLGLDQEKWWKRFSTQQEMFEYAATCRMFWVRDVAEDEADGDATGIVAQRGQEGGAEGKKKLKHNDRQRLVKRPIFKAWVDEFIPMCREAGRYSDSKITREQIRNEVFKKFSVKEEYETRRHDWNLARHLVEVMNDGIKANIPVDGGDNQTRSAATKVLKGVIMEGELYEGAVPEAAIRDQNGFYNIQLVKLFVVENWRNAMKIGIARQRARAREAMKAKAEKKARVARDSSLYGAVYIDNTD